MCAGTRKASAKMKGYADQVLYFDLGSSKSETREFEAEDRLKYIGGSGLGAKILLAETDGQTDPLSSENVLIFMTGPFTNTSVPCSGRHFVISKSPLTTCFGEANAGGSWGEILKKSGFDGIVLKGKAKKPVYLWINRGRIEVRDAGHIWGRDTFETEKMVKSETDQKASIACIGPGGENRVAFASIMNDGIHARTAARCGMGAVMGAKNVKAIAVNGNSETEIHDADALSKSIRDVSNVILEKARGLKELGTAGAVQGSEALGGLPVRNWRHIERWEEGAKSISGGTFLPIYATGNFACRKCMIGCGKTVQIKEGKYKGPQQGGPEYETLALLGSNCLINDSEVIIKANEMCNRYGLDTMSTGSVVAFAMEAFEKGIITRKDTDGIELTWGNGEALLETIKRIGEYQGIGKLLGMGTKRAAETLGRNSIEFAVHVKGLECAAHDPRVYFGGAVNFATASRGACHLGGFTHVFDRGMLAPEIDIKEPVDRFEWKGKGILAAKTQNLMGMLDSLGICKFILFGGVGISLLVEWYEYVTGRTLDIQRFLLTGERIFNLKRIYNTKCGISRKDDFLPFRMSTLKKKDWKGQPLNLPPIGQMLSDYYECRGWSEEGIPTEEKLLELDIRL